MVFNAPAQVTLAGHEGAQAQYMGVYELNGEVVHDGPLYVQSRGLENAVAGLILRRRGPRAGLRGSCRPVVAHLARVRRRRLVNGHRVRYVGRTRCAR